MKYYAVTILLMSLISTSCNNTGKEEGKRDTEKEMQPGVLVAADSMPIVEAPNRPYFSVKLFSTEHTARYGAYKVVADWGMNHGETEFSMPKGGETLKPVLRKGDEPYTYIVGFHYDDQPEFYDYYQISAGRGEMKMKYLKAYSFQ